VYAYVVKKIWTFGKATILSIVATPVLLVIWLFFILSAASGTEQSTFSLIVSTVIFSALFPHYGWFVSGPLYDFFAVHGGGEMLFFLLYVIYGLIIDGGRNTSRLRLAITVVLAIHGALFAVALISEWNGYQESQELQRLYGS